MPVLVFFSVTVAPGTTAAVESRTVPSTLAVSNCAEAEVVMARVATMTAIAMRHADARGRCPNIGSPFGMWDLELGILRTSELLTSLAERREPLHETHHGRHDGLRLAVTVSPTAAARIENLPSEVALQKRDDLLPAFGGFLVADVVAQQLPPLWMAGRGVDA